MLEISIGIDSDLHILLGCSRSDSSTYGDSFNVDDLSTGTLDKYVTIFKGKSPMCLPSTLLSHSVDANKISYQGKTYQHNNSK